MGRIRAGLAALAMLGAWALPAAAVEVQSVKLPERVRFAENGAELIINGMGVRKRIFVSVYVGALYLPRKTPSADAVLSADTSSRRLAIHVLRDEITAIQLTTEANERRIAFADIQELADRISRPPYNWTPELIWNAYEAVDVGRVRHSNHHTLTDLVSLLRYTVGVDSELVPYAARVQERYAAWLAQQAQAGSEFSPDERWWLDHMVDVIASSAGISADDLDRAPFTEKGGVDGALRDLGDRAEALLDQLNTELTA